MIGRSLDLYDAFYRDLAINLDRLADVGPFIVFDVHSYNCRRQGPAGPEDPAQENPDINVGTKAMRGRWRSVIDSFIGALDGVEVAGKPLDVRENIRFGGANLSHWVHENYPTTGCVLALEFKKTFMDEWTGHVDKSHLDDLIKALAGATPAVVEAVQRSAR